MFESLFNIFSNGNNQKKAPTKNETSNKEHEIKGYMFVFQPLHLKTLDIAAYLRGDKDKEFQNRAARFKAAFQVTDKFYSSVDELIQGNQKDFPHLDGSCYILCMKYNKNETYRLINEGRLHEAIDHAIKFHEAYRAYFEKKEAANSATVTDNSPSRRP